jgi:cell division protein FtsI/penicillin-binding protein 2
MNPQRVSTAILVPVVALLVAGVAVPRAEELTGLVPPAAVPEAVPVAASAALVAPTATSTATPTSTATSTPTATPAESVVPAVIVAPERPPAVPQTLAPRRDPVRIGEPRYDPATGRWTAALGGGRATLTIDAHLQERLERSLESYRVPWGATVLIEPRTGRVLALAEHSRVEPGRKGFALSAVAPAASVFKIVTAAALLEKGAAEGEVCWHGGKRRLDPRLLRDDPRRDRRCSSLTSAFGHSTNVVFAKLADRDLDPTSLRTMAERFQFNVPIDFARPVQMSTARVPEDPFAAANTAAGFGAVRLSPLHGALLAAIVANGGVYVPPALVDEATGAPLPAPGASVRVVDEAVAARLAEMMRETVVAGTARRAFRRPGSALRGVAVAGKTGSLADRSPFRDYSWFVGYAPADHPQVAVATLIVNDRLWHARAPQVAREALEAFFASRALHAGSGAVRTAAVR